MKSETKYVFFGTPRFAEIVLDGLIADGLIPRALVCNPDRPLGRKKIITPPPTKQLIVDKKLSTIVLQPEKLDDEFITQLRALEPNFFVVAAYAKIIPRAVLSIPRFGTLGTHPSLLPKYRGASPIQSVLLAGETKTGSTIYQMDEKMDHGPIFAQRELAIAPDDDYASLEKKLSILSKNLLGETLLAFAAENADAGMSRAQDESAATFTKKFATEDGLVSEADLDAATHRDPMLARSIFNKIRAFNSEPGCWTFRATDHKRVKLLKAKLGANGLLKLEIVQEEGQKPKKI